MKYALIDMGSNSIRLTVYDMDQTSFKVLFKEKIMAGLAGYVEHGRLTRDGIDCACQSLHEFRSTLELLQIEHLAVFATASLRNICSAVYEVVQKRPDITAREAVASGFAVGRAACGSATTTLLLAYSGSYIALLMVFMAQGTPVEFILNYKYVAAEIVHTVVGSFGLVTVAPLTAITSGLLLTRRGA